MARFKKGQSGNPKGRPRKFTSITEIMRTKSQEILEINGKQLTRAEFIAEKVFALAASGDQFGMKTYLERVDGAPKQQVEVSGAEGGPIQSSIQIEFLAPGEKPKADDHE